jgi:hypothetical protein
MIVAEFAAGAGPVVVFPVAFVGRSMGAPAREGGR